uniref:Venom protein n=1 Tax=Hadrurus spadix TaxID=141984 RepID=A0A1W7R980_9SCOR
MKLLAVLFLCLFILALLPGEVYCNEIEDNDERERIDERTICEIICKILSPDGKELCMKKCEEIED